jgi:hypothetical protein
MKGINNKVKFFLLFITFIVVILSFRQLEGFRTPITLGNLVTSQGEPANVIPTRPPAVNMDLLYGTGGSLTESTYNSITGSTAPTTQGQQQTQIVIPPPRRYTTTYTPPPMVVNPPNVVNDSTIQEVAPLPTTSTMSTITYAALGTVLVGGIGYASFLALKVV